MTVIKSIHLAPEERWIHPQAVILTSGHKRRQGVTAAGGHPTAGEMTADSGSRRQRGMQGGSPAKRPEVFHAGATSPHTPTAPSSHPITTQGDG